MRRATLNFELKIVHCVRSEYAAAKMSVKKTLEMYGDVGIAEQQKVRKQAGMMA